MSVSVYLLCFSCTGFLEQKPSSTINLPTTDEDLWALMNNSSVINRNEPGLGEIGGDNYFLLDVGWNAITQEAERTVYLWQKTPVLPAHWNPAYTTIAYANTVLDYVDQVAYTIPQSKNMLIGTARFHRARNYYRITQVFSHFYRKEKNPDDLGFAYRKDGDASNPSYRMSLAESYAYLIKEFKEASRLLPAKVTFPTEPSKSAAFSMLANLHLELEDFETAYVYADSAIYYNSGIILDFQDIDRTLASPFQRFNEEVVFHTLLNGGTTLSPSRAKVADDLITLYEERDLRKEAFFRLGNDGYYVFKGNYDGSATSASLFSGITVPELYLQRAEAALLSGRTSQAVDDLNELRQKRGLPILAGEHIYAEEMELLEEVINERRRELAFRGRRWQDLRRYAARGLFEDEISRTINGVVYRLGSKDILDYAFFIPELVIENSNIVQNE